MVERSITRWRYAVAMLGLMVPVAGCAQPESHQHSDEEAAEMAFDNLYARAAKVEVLSYAENLADYLPGQLVAVDGSDPRPLGQGVVHGRVEEVRPLSAASFGTLKSGEEDPDGQPVDFYDEDADWRTVAVTISIQKAWGSDLPATGTVDFILPVGASIDPNEFMRGIESLNNVFVVLAGGRDPEAPSYYRVAESDTALGTVNENGQISFPAMGPESREFLGELTSVSDVAAAASRPQTTIVVKDGNVVRR